MNRRAHKALLARIPAWPERCRPPAYIPSHATLVLILPTEVPQDLPLHISIRNMRAGGVQTFEEAAAEMREVLTS